MLTRHQWFDRAAGGDGAPYGTLGASRETVGVFSARAAHDRPRGALPSGPKNAPGALASRAGCVPHTARPRGDPGASHDGSAGPAGSSTPSAVHPGTRAIGSVMMMRHDHVFAFRIHCLMPVVHRLASLHRRPGRKGRRGPVSWQARRTCAKPSYSSLAHRPPLFPVGPGGLEAGTTPFPANMGEIGDCSRRLSLVDDGTCDSWTHCSPVARTPLLRRAKARGKSGRTWRRWQICRAATCIAKAKVEQVQSTMPTP